MAARIATWLPAVTVTLVAAALWSRRQGATPREAAVAAMFPAIVAFGLTIIATPLDILVDVVIARGHGLEHTFCGTAWLLASVVLAPGAALALGLLAATVWERHAPRAGARAVQPEAGRA